MSLDAGDVCVAIETAAYGTRDRAVAGRGHAIAGGSGVGVVVGAGVAAGEWLDRRVVIARLGPCGECHFCRRGAVAGCADARELGVDRPGTLAPEVTVRARWLAPADGELEIAAPGAILGDDALVAYTLYCRVGVAAGDPVVCLGGGPRTALVAQIAAAKGARVAAVDDLGEVAGDDFADRPWRIFALDGGAVGAVPAGSSVALGDGASIDLGAAMAAGVAVTGGEHGHPDLLPELVALARRGALDLEAVTEPVNDRPVAEVAGDILAAGRIPIVELSRPS